MSRLKYELAQKSDDQKIRELLQEISMDGSVSLVFKRDPNYFWGADVEGQFNQTLVVKDQINERIVGMGSRSIRSVYLNENVENIGYLSSLRIREKFRNKLILFKTYKYLKELHRDKKTKIYLTTVMEDNKRARELLVAGRADLPQYHDMGQYHTYVIPLKNKKRFSPGRLKIIRGSNEMIDQIWESLNRYGKQKQFFPYYTKKDFLNDMAGMRGLSAQDFYLAMKNDRIVGVCAKWDQKTFKQIVVSNYKGRMKVFKPIYNLWASFFKYPSLPKEGQSLNTFYVSFIAIQDNDINVFKSLLSSIYDDAQGNNYSYMIVGLHEKDPLINALEGFPRVRCLSRVYVACWEDGEDTLRLINGKIPYLEVATL